ncbi:centrosomal protein 43-like isoform X2 [Battus philenor]|uniref:centrosomal protein 43-like isoform X2 n=1 Tax=Battus philenor TaxID=42288 RepID=UPI0035CF70B2
MAQAEDTELRDLVVEALEKNGSLAKIRALLRANIFLVFEDDCENIKQNINLDNLLKLPEGIFCLSLIHEFLEFCNLKNTLFVYMSESRQGKDYTYEGHNSLFEKLKLSKRNKEKEPILVTLVKNVLQQQTKSFGHNIKKNDKTFKDGQNNTYIVHEDSSSSISHSNSDNSSDEKTKLHLRLQLDNSDTDTSSDSTRGKTSSEYIPSEHMLAINKSPHSNHLQDPEKLNSNVSAPVSEVNKILSNSDSTSYVDIKPLSSLDKMLINTTGVPCTEDKSGTDSIKSHSQTETPAVSQNLVVNYSSEINKIDKQKSDGSINDLTEYSLDFNSPASGKNEADNKQVQSPDSIHEQLNLSSPLKFLHQQQYDQKSISSPSSVSTSEAADVISDISNSSVQKNIEKNVSKNKAIYFAFLAAQRSQRRFMKKALKISNKKNQN